MAAWKKVTTFHGETFINLDNVCWMTRCRDWATERCCAVMGPVGERKRPGFSTSAESGTGEHARLGQGRHVDWCGGDHRGDYHCRTWSLVSRFRSSHHCAAGSFANFGIEGP
jgi:hypothetical protein